MSGQLVFTSYKGAFQVMKGGPLVYFDAMWPSGKWRDGFERIFGDTDWESVDSSIHFIELIGHTSDGMATWLVGDDSDKVPPCSTIVRHKGIVALGNPAESEVIATLKQQLEVATATTSPGAATVGTSNVVPITSAAKKASTVVSSNTLDDFPVVFSI